MARVYLTPVERMTPSTTDKLCPNFTKEPARTHNNLLNHGPTKSLVAFVSSLTLWLVLAGFVAVVVVIVYSAFSHMPFGGTPEKLI